MRGVGGSPPTPPRTIKKLWRQGKSSYNFAWKNPCKRSPPVLPYLHNEWANRHWKWAARPRPCLASRNWWNPSVVWRIERTSHRRPRSGFSRNGGGMGPLDGMGWLPLKCQAKNPERDFFFMRGVGGSPPTPRTIKNCGVKKNLSMQTFLKNILQIIVRARMLYAWRMKSRLSFKTARLLKSSWKMERAYGSEGTKAKSPFREMAGTTKMHNGTRSLLKSKMPSTYLLKKKLTFYLTKRQKPLSYFLWLSAFLRIRLTW